MSIYKDIIFEVKKERKMAIWEEYVLKWFLISISSEYSVENYDKKLPEYLNKWEGSCLLSNFITKKRVEYLLRNCKHIFQMKITKRRLK